MDTRLGTKVSAIILNVVTLPFIQSIMVVTSPIGDHAPPELAARMIIPAKNHLSSLSSISFRSRATITMVVVRLSKTADIKNVTILIIHSSLLLSLVVILSVIIRKPLCLSIISTMVMAPNKKNSISDVSPRCPISSSCWKPGPNKANTVHIITASNRAEAVLFTFSGCSKAMLR